jgi:hypothetical protein
VNVRRENGELKLVEAASIKLFPSRRLFHAAMSASFGELSLENLLQTTRLTSRESRVSAHLISFLFARVDKREFQVNKATGNLSQICIEFHTCFDSGTLFESATSFECDVPR